MKHLLIVLLPEEISKVDLKELEVLLSKVYEELKENISQDMKNYLEKKIKFYSFLCDFHSSEDPIELFANQPEVDYEIDKYLLSLIIEIIEKQRKKSCSLK